MSVLYQLSRRLASKPMSKNIIASFGNIVNRNCAPLASMRDVNHLQIQKRVESNGSLKALSDCFRNEIAGEEESKPQPDFLKMVKEIEKSFTIVDEAGKGTIKRANRVTYDRISATTRNNEAHSIFFRLHHFEERAQK